MGVGSGVVVAPLGKGVTLGVDLWALVEVPLALPLGEVGSGLQNQALEHGADTSTSPP